MDTWLTGYDVDNYHVRKHIFAITVLSPRLADLLLAISLRYANDENHQDLLFYAEHALEECKACIEKTTEAAVRNCGIPHELLSRAASIYGVYDYIMLAATIPEKAQMWNVAFSLAHFEQTIDGGDQMPRLCDLLLEEHSGIPVLDEEDILISLGDKTAEISGWADTEFYEEWELCEYSEEFDDFDEFFGILEKLEYMEDEIRKIKLGKEAKEE